MEKVAGTQLEQVWPSMKITDKFNVVKAIAGFQKKWASISFHKFGSLYYTNDLDTQSDDAFLYTDVEGTKVKNSTFSVGPSTGRELFDNGRALIDFDRGPCKVSLLKPIRRCFANEFQGRLWKNTMSPLETEK